MRNDPYHTHILWVPQFVEDLCNLPTSNARKPARESDAPAVFAPADSVN